RTFGRDPAADLVGDCGSINSLSLASRSSRRRAVLRAIASLACSCSRLKSDSRFCALLRSVSALRRAAEILGRSLILFSWSDGKLARGWGGRTRRFNASALSRAEDAMG